MSDLRKQWAVVYVVAHDEGDGMCGGFNLHGIYTDVDAAQAHLNEIESEGWFLGAAVYPVPLNIPGWLGYKMDGFELSDEDEEVTE